MKVNQLFMRYILILVLFNLNGPLISDAGGYAGNKIIIASNNQISIIHRHDWSQKTRNNRWKMIKGDQNPLRANNNYASIECVDNETHDVLFRIPSPALSYIYLSEDSKYIIGLSNIKLFNPIQIIVIDGFGKTIFLSPISSEETRLSIKEFQGFEIEYPKEASKLKRNNRVLKIKDTIYINYSNISVGEKALTYLVKHSMPSHFSRNISESETNFVDWYKTPDPEIRLRIENGNLAAISLLDPIGERFEIPIQVI